jgi:hypothetical protein
MLEEKETMTDAQRTLEVITSGSRQTVDPRPTPEPFVDARSAGDEDRLAAQGEALVAFLQPPASEAVN